MICPTCYGPSRITRTLDTGTEVTRIHECMDAACDSVWTTDQKLRPGSLRKNRRAIRRQRTATNGIDGGTAPPTDADNLPVRTNGAGGVGGGLSSGSDLDPVSHPDPSRQSPQDLPRARPGIWTVSDWRRRYSNVWCDKYGGTAIGGDGEADRKLRELLESLPDADLLAAQARASEMFAEFLAETGEPARARHRWSWFVGRWDSLRVPAQRETRAPQYQRIGAP